MNLRNISWAMGLVLLVSNRFTCPFHVTNKLLFTIAIYLNLLAFAFSPCG